jgi:prepilin-type N-terminal cleavage/methylation domain-containing protein
MKSSLKGFTLIELLVVISIIGILAGTSLVSMQQMRISARDTARKRDIVQLEKALVQYWERTGEFPDEVGFDSSIGGDNCNCPGSGGPTGCTGTDWCAGDMDADTHLIYEGIVTEKKIMATLPVDPMNNVRYYYSYEPCCDQDCGGGRSCLGKGCCEYTIGASELEGTGTPYSRWGRWEQ